MCQPKFDPIVEADVFDGDSFLKIQRCLGMKSPVLETTDLPENVLISVYHYDDGHRIYRCCFPALGCDGTESSGRAPETGDGL